MLARMMNNFSPLLRLHDQMNRLFENFYEDLPAARPYGQSYPAMNTWEDADAAWVEAELPGLTMNDLEVTVCGRDVTIKGERKIGDPDAANAPGLSWHRRERSQGRFARSLSLPWDVDADKVEAKLHGGVLTVKLPKAESARPKKVKVLTA